MRKRTIAILLAAGAVTASAFCMAGCSGCAAEEPAAPDADIVVPDVPGGTTEPGGEEQPPAEHEHALAYHPAEAAACTADGHAEYWQCTGCGKYFADGGAEREVGFDSLLIKGGHAYVYGEVSAGCTTGGYEFAKCAACGDGYIVEGSATAPLGHDWGQWHTREEPGCESAGVRERSCIACGAEEREELPPAGHAYIARVHAAGCNEGGCTEYVCTACGDTYTDGYTGPLGHEYEEKKTEGTCTEPGYVLAVCVRCGDEYVKSVSSELGAHAVGEWEYLQAPSCTEDGVRWRKCENFDECGYYEEEEVPAVGHDRGGWVTVKAATCTAEGEQARECRVCGDAERRTVDELGHDYVASEAAGGTEYVCVRCGDGYFLPDAEQEGAVYALSADGLSYIVTGAERGAAEIAIPDEHLGLPVTEIADGAFEGNTVITRATLGGNIARIGERAFYGCSSLLCVNVPESAEYMGEGAFGHCVALESVRYDAADIAECYNVFPNAGTEGGGLTLHVGAAAKRIPANLFYAPGGAAPGLEEVLFDEGSALEEIGDGAFSGCARLGRICLPASVARIGVEAFYGCASLEYARVPAAATVCSGAFADVSDAFDCVLF